MQRLRGLFQPLRAFIVIIDFFLSVGCRWEQKPPIDQHFSICFFLKICFSFLRRPFVALGSDKDWLRQEVQLVPLSNKKSLKIFSKINICLPMIQKRMKNTNMMKIGKSKRIHNISEDWLRQASWFFSSFSQREISAKLGREAVRRIGRKSYERKVNKDLFIDLKMPIIFKIIFIRLPKAGILLVGLRKKRGEGRWKQGIVKKWKSSLNAEWKWDQLCSYKQKLDASTFQANKISLFLKLEWWGPVKEGGFTDRCGAVIRRNWTQSAERILIHSHPLFRKWWHVAVTFLLGFTFTTTRISHFVHLMTTI